MNIKEFAQYVLDTVQDSVETNNTGAVYAYVSVRLQEE